MFAEPKNQQFNGFNGGSEQNEGSPKFDENGMKVEGVGQFLRPTIPQPSLEEVKGPIGVFSGNLTPQSKN
jgi:hypothetical protein